MTHKLRKNDPLFYKMALRGLLDEAQENGVTVTVKGNTIIFDDRMEFMDEEVISTSCSIEIKNQG